MATAMAAPLLSYDVAPALLAQEGRHHADDHGRLSESDDKRR
jgi:hypothetical protein